MPRTEVQTVATQTGVTDMTITAQYTAGYGWQYVIHKDGKLFGRYGSFETKTEAIRAGATHFI